MRVRLDYGIVIACEHATCVRGWRRECLDILEGAKNAAASGGPGWLCVSLLGAVPSLRRSRSQGPRTSFGGAGERVRAAVVVVVRALMVGWAYGHCAAGVHASVCSGRPCPTRCTLVVAWRPGHPLERQLVVLTRNHQRSFSVCALSQPAEASSRTSTLTIAADDPRGVARRHGPLPRQRPTEPVPWTCTNALKIGGSFPSAPEDDNITKIISSIPQAT